MKKLVVGCFTFLLIGALISGYIFFFRSFSDGYRAGTVIKMTKKGFLFTTNEGQMNTGGFIDDSGETSIIWNFSVTDEEVIKKIEEAVDSGKKVKLYYKEKFVQLFFLGDTKYFVYKVEVIGN